MHAVSIRKLCAVAFLIFSVGMGAKFSVAQINVDTPTPGITSGQCSLQEAIYAAEFGANKAVSQYFNGKDVTYQTGCSDPTGNWNTIVLQNVTYAFNALWDGDTHNPFGPTATPIIFKTITIQGNGATLQWTGGGYSRLFAVGYASVNNLDDGTSYSGTGNLTLQDVYVQGFKTHGGNGACGGGGGLGAGGAIYVGKVPGSGTPALTIEKSTFLNNVATGGNGSPYLQTCSIPKQTDYSPGGGGGGLYGNGGMSFAGDYGNGAGGGGGARGDGGAGSDGAGGGGGGTVFSGVDALADPSQNNLYIHGGPGGYLCGGSGADRNNDSNSSSNPPSSGQGATCSGGGGGGSAVQGAGGNGQYGGGGGGSGWGNGGNGGFGGGGGAASAFDQTQPVSAGKGGFGGGGGGGLLEFAANGQGGAFAGSGGNTAGFGFGGSGAALGGAVFNDGGIVAIINTTFATNSVHAGSTPANPFYSAPPQTYGLDAGGAIFSRNGSLSVENVTISGNTTSATATGGGVVVMNDGAAASLKLDNTILANNGSNECYVVNSVSLKGSGNLIMANDPSHGCPGVAQNTDPQLGPLQPNSPGDTPTMAIQIGSSAVDNGDDAALASDNISTDQRGAPRPQAAHTDIGAYEAPPPSADLSITKSVSPVTAQPGDTITYTLAVSNAGPNTANNVSVSDTLSSYLTFVSCSESTGTGTCTFSGSTVTVSYASMAANVSSSVTIKATLNPGVPDGMSVGNNAGVSDSDPIDPNTANNASNTVYFTIHNKADLQVTKTVSAAQILAGDPLTYTIQVHNAGPYDGENVVITDSQPAGVTFTSCSSTVGTCNLSNGLVTLKLASFLNQASATITVQATLNYGTLDGSTITNTASGSESTFDPDPSNNAGSASFLVQNKSDLFITKQANLTAVKATQNLVYAVTVQNLGPYRAAAVVMNDPIPANSGFVSLNSGTIPCTTPAVGAVGTVTCNPGNLSNGATVTFTITVKVGGATNKVSISNTATANSPNFDPNLANNTATATTQITGNKK